MEDFKLDILIGKGPTARSIRLDLPRFTLVGATTRTGLVAGPLRDRFGFVGRLDLYDPAELEAIVLRSAGILGVPIDPEGARRIAERSRGTPRIANRLLKRVRDFVEVRADGTITVGRRRGRPRGVRGGRARASTRWTGPSSTCCAAGSAAGRSASPRWPSASARSPTPSRTPTSRTCSSRACSSARPGPDGRAAGLGPPRPAAGRGHAALTAVGRAGGRPDCSRRDVRRTGSGRRRPVCRAMVRRADRHPDGRLRLRPARRGHRPGAGRAAERGPAAGRPRRGRRRRPPGTRTVADLPGLLGPGDVLVVNDTRVLPARLALAKADGRPGRGAAARAARRRSDGGRRVGGAGPAGPPPARRAPCSSRPGGDRARSVVVGEAVDPDPEGAGTRGSACSTRRWSTRSGAMPLPPYIHRTPGRPGALPDRLLGRPRPGRPVGRRPDRRPALHPGAAGRVPRRPGPALARVDLAIGLDTFRPVTAATAEEHVIHTERYTVPAETVAACAAAGPGGGRGHHGGAGPGVGGGHRGAVGPDRPLHPRGLPVPGGRRAGHQLPPAPLQPAAAGRGVLRAGVARAVRRRRSPTGYRFLSFGDAMVVGRAGPKGRRPGTRPGARR